MARKTKTCTRTALRTVMGVLSIQKCMLGRGHSGRCWDGSEAF